MDSSHSLDDIIRLTAQTDSFKEVVDRLQKGREQILLHGLPSTLAAFLAAHIRSALDRPVLLVAADEDRAEKPEPKDVPHAHHHVGVHLLRVVPLFAFGG